MALHGGGERSEHPFITALLPRFGLINTAVLNVAVELNIFEIIAKGSPNGVSASEIASEIETHKDSEFCGKLDRMLCLLATNSLLTCSTRTVNNAVGVERLYQLSAAGKYLVDDQKTGSMALSPALISQRPFIEVFLNFKELLSDNDNNLFKKVRGMHVFQSLQRDSTMNNVFNKSMETISAVQIKHILEIYNGFEGISLLVDVGGGVGRCLNAVISKYPSIKGVNFDLPHVIQHAPPYPGIEHVGGDMFESVPKGDAIILKTVCHDWSDEKCLKLLRNCYEALSENGKVIVVDHIMAEEIQSNDADKFVSCMDNLMFIYGGRERTKKEFEILCNSAGFSNFKVVCSVLSTIGVMEFHKA